MNDVHPHPRSGALVSTPSATPGTSSPAAAPVAGPETAPASGRAPAQGGAPGGRWGALGPVGLVLAGGSPCSSGPRWR